MRKTTDCNHKQRADHNQVKEIRRDKIERGARDFAARFEDVMRDLADG